MIESAIRQIVREEITLALERAGLLCQHSISTSAVPGITGTHAHCTKCGSTGPFTMLAGGGPPAGRPPALPEPT